MRSGVGAKRTELTTLASANVSSSERYSYSSKWDVVPDRYDKDLCLKFGTRLLFSLMIARNFLIKDTSFIFHTASRLRNSLILLFCISVFFVQSVSAGEKRPLIIIPGIMGSKLCDEANNVVWGDRLSYTKNRLALIKLPPSFDKDKLPIKSCGLIQSVNIIPLLWESDEYSGLLHFLKNDPDLMYSEKDIVEFDYDWRLSNFDTAEKLKSYIESHYAVSQKVDIIAHSMGGLAARIYIQRLGGDERVQSLILLGTPSFGSAEIFERLKNGFEHWPSLFSGGQTAIQETILSFPSVYQLLPTYDDCCGFSSTADPNAAKSVDILNPQTWEKFSWVPSAFKAGEFKQSMIANLKVASELKKEMHSAVFKDPKEELARVHFIGNGFQDTWSRVFFDPNDGTIVGNTVQPGDGVVTLYSATNSNVGRVQPSLEEHDHIFRGQLPELIIRATLSNRKWTSAYAGFSQTLQLPDHRTFIVDHVTTSIPQRTSAPGDKVDFAVSLDGQIGLNTLPASVLSVVLLDTKDGTDVPLSKLDSAPNELKITGSLQAPPTPGAYEIEIRCTGLAPLHLIFAVVAW